ncbi:oxygen-independent coproporphyrinogen-3 oxidase [Sediminibacterium ginsengisoli]|uniref:Heme chaperone HemW n=2 Tax=Sediminibacterium ginsengisoli TaxID=413434 RepID=A0A1T4JVM4_9BACT|nr:oxygen-independent coproporphyrinogen-3 oxidase [Sediminibacterium ginsengisoli]
MVDAIIREAHLKKNYITGPVETIYLGGGTPSLLTQAQLDAIISTLYQLFTVVPGAEITLETNPDDIDETSLAGWKQSGVNRLSIGIQSFADADLAWMNRAHNASQALNAIRFAKEAGFDNITADLIYGTPTLSDEQWLINIETLLNAGIPHISCYALTVEPKTALDQLIRQHKLEDVDPDKQARHFEILTQKLAEAGFEHYEISNFALPGFRSRHNSSYWQGKPYLGLGPSAHSFNGSSRQWNMANNSLYLAGVTAGTIPGEEEILTPQQQLNEYIMTSLRTLEGVSVEHVRMTWGHDQAERLMAAVQKHISNAHVLFTENRLKLNASGKFLADGIAADLFDL